MKLPVLCRILVPVTFACLLLVPAARAEKKPAPRQTVLIPFKPLRNHGVPLVEVRLNDKVTGTFLIDTGASDCLLTDKIARKLGLNSQPAFKNGLALSHGGYKQDEFVTVQRLQLGSLVLTQLSFIVIGSKDLFKFSEQPVDGILGGTLLSKFTMLLDFPRRLMAMIYPAGLSEEEIKQMGFQNALGLPLKRYREAVPEAVFKYWEQDIYSTSITCRNGASEGKEELYVDTGAPTTSISRRLAQRLKLEPIGKSTASTMHNGSELNDIARVPTLQAGDLVLKNFKVDYSSRKDSDIPSLLGEDVLSSCVALFDFAKGKLYLKPLLPPLVAGGPVDPSRVDKARLRQAAELPGIDFSLSLSLNAADEDDDPPTRIAALEKALKGDAGDAERYGKLGDLYHQEKEPQKEKAAYAKAAELYREQVKAKPGDAGLLSKLAEALSDAEKDDEAETAARQAVALAPKEADPSIALGWALHAKSVLALTGKNKTVDIKPDDLSAYQELIGKLLKNRPAPARAAEAQRLSQAARASFDKAVSLAPENPKVYRARAEFIADDGLGVQATLRELRGDALNVLAEINTTAYLDDVQRVARLSADDIDTLRSTALIEAMAPVWRNEKGLDFREGKYWHSLSGRVRRSVQEKMDRLESLAKSPDKAIAARALEAVGYLDYEVIQDYPLAEATLRRALALDPVRARAAYTLAEMLTGDRRYEEIVALLEERITKRDSAQDHLLLAKALERLDKLDQVERHARAAVKLRPDSFTPNLALAAALLRRSDTDPAKLSEAKACLDRAEKAMGNNPDRSQKTDAGNTRAIHLALTGDLEGAKARLLQVLEDERMNTEAKAALAALVLPTQ